jgi:hypothetical protein
LQEIFAVRVLPGRRWPELVNDDPKLLADSFVPPDERSPTCRRPTAG